MKIVFKADSYLNLCVLDRMCHQYLLSNESFCIMAGRRWLNMTTRALLTRSLCTHSANQEYAAALLRKRSRASLPTSYYQQRSEAGRVLEASSKVAWQLLGITTAALQNGCHGSCKTAGNSWPRSFHAFVM